MQRVLLPLCLIAAALAGCAQEAPRPDERALLYVPSGAFVERPARPINAYAALPGSDDPDFWVPRAEKIAYGTTTIGGFAAFTTYTYDAQAISTPFGSGYRYRWVSESGFAAPPPSP